jgi:type I restriction enzyme S subunit
MSMIGWNEEELGSILTLNYGWSLPENKRIPGDVPVYGSNGIVGTHKQALVASPGVIVGRKGSAGNIHFSSKPFCPIDTTFYVAPGNTSLDIEFLYFLLLHIDLKRILGDVGVPGLNREMAYKEKARFPTRADEQRKIAGVLGVVQRAVEEQERLMAVTTELKKGLMHKLFTEGLRGERQKQTEIGSVPESWEVVRLGDVISEEPKNGLYKHRSAYGSGTLILRIEDFSNDGDIVNSASNRVLADDSENRIYALKKNDIVTNRVNSLSHLGKTALVGELLEPMVFESNMMRYRVDERQVLPSYILRLLNSPVCKKQIIENAKRAVAQSSINQGNLKSILLPMPSVESQKELIGILETVVNKINVHERTKYALTDLFRTLLHQLMTAQIRVHDLDLSALEVATKET